MSYSSPSIKNLLIATLFSARNIRKFHAIIKEKEFQQYKKESIYVALSKLNSKGYINKSPSGWSLTKAGKKHFKNKNLLSYITSPFNKNSSHNLIIAFDIPEKDRKIRHWLRNQIKIFNYTMLQQSLWIGPGPLPSLFLKRIDDLNIKKNIKTFKITKVNK